MLLIVCDERVELLLPRHHGCLALLLLLRGQDFLKPQESLIGALLRLELLGQQVLQQQ